MEDCYSYNIMYFCMYVCMYLCRFSNRQVVNGAIAVLGGATLSYIEDEVLASVPIQYRRNAVQTYFRVEMGNQVFYSSMYTRTKKRNSYTISFQANDGSRCYGQVKKYISIGGNILAVIKLLCPTMIPSECLDIDTPTMDYSKKLYAVR